MVVASMDCYGRQRFRCNCYQPSNVALEGQKPRTQGLSKRCMVEMDHRTQVWKDKIGSMSYWDYFQGRKQIEEQRIVLFSGVMVEKLRVCRMEEANKWKLPIYA